MCCVCISHAVGMVRSHAQHGQAWPGEVGRESADQAWVEIQSQLLQMLQRPRLQPCSWECWAAEVVILQNQRFNLQAKVAEHGSLQTQCWLLAHSMPGSPAI